MTNGLGCRLCERVVFFRNGGKYLLTAGSMHSGSIGRGGGGGAHGRACYVIFWGDSVS